MPLYDYKCDVCEHVFEELTSPDAPPPGCPLCDGKGIRVLSAGVRVIWDKAPPTWSGGREPGPRIQQKPGWSREK
jgi:putative FmdB family regulatory protein